VILVSTSSDTMMAAVIHEHGGPDIIRYEPFPRPVAKAGEVLLRVRATSLNRLDLWARSGPPVKIFPWNDHEFPIISGSDCAGEVAELGEGVTNVAVGDRVVFYPSLSCGSCEYCLAGEQTMCLHYEIFGEQTHGAMAEYAAVPANQLIKIADHVSFDAAAAMPVAYTTAWRMIGTCGEIQAGDIVLVLGVGGGVGSAALTMAKGAGATVFVTAGTVAKRTKALELGALAAFDNNTGPFSNWVMEQTGGRGVDIVVDPLGATWQESIRSLARNGRLVVCGATAGNKPEFDVRELYQRHRRIYGAPMGNWSDFTNVIGRLNSGQITPVIDRVYPLSEISDAHRRAESRESFGKIVVIP
jgi:NADPH:quinone reductase-like Zn-dependent oxidoreductase